MASKKTIVGKEEGGQGGGGGGGGQAAGRRERDVKLDLFAQNLALNSDAADSDWPDVRLLIHL